MVYHLRLHWQWEHKVAKLSLFFTYIKFKTCIADWRGWEVARHGGSAPRTHSGIPADGASAVFRMCLSGGLTDGLRLSGSGGVSQTAESQY